MQVRIWKRATVVGLLAGSIVSAAMTFVDWLLNPAGLFHTELGTDWGVVTETALSWLGPVTLGTFLATIIVLYVIAWIRGSK